MHFEVRQGNRIHANLQNGASLLRARAGGQLRIPLVEQLKSLVPKPPPLPRLGLGFDPLALMSCLESMNGRANQPGVTPVYATG